MTVSVLGLPRSRGRASATRFITGHEDSLQRLASCPGDLYGRASLFSQVVGFVLDEQSPRGIRPFFARNGGGDDHLGFAGGRQATAVAQSLATLSRPRARQCCERSRFVFARHAADLPGCHCAYPDKQVRLIARSSHRLERPHLPAPFSSWAPSVIASAQGSIELFDGRHLAVALGALKLWPSANTSKRDRRSQCGARQSSLGRTEVTTMASVLIDAIDNNCSPTSVLRAVSISGADCQLLTRPSGYRTQGSRCIMRPQLGSANAGRMALSRSARRAMACQSCAAYPHVTMLPTWPCRSGCAGSRLSRGFLFAVAWCHEGRASLPRSIQKSPIQPNPSGISRLTVKRRRTVAAEEI